MPKLIDYPRTSYAGAWELAEVTDDTGGKCTFDTAARKLNRKVSGSFKAIIGSAVKFGLLTSKRDLLTTTTLFKRIKHAYDKQEELLFHREAFLTPPLFTQLCRKFRSRELPVQMLDVMLIREFGVEEINAPGVAKAFVEGTRAVGLLDNQNIVADIDALNAQRPPRRELASPPPSTNNFRTDQEQPPAANGQHSSGTVAQQASNATDLLRLISGPTALMDENVAVQPAAPTLSKPDGPDAIASLFGLNDPSSAPESVSPRATPQLAEKESSLPRTLQMSGTTPSDPAPLNANAASIALSVPETSTFHIQISGPGVNTTLSIIEEADITIAVALLEKIRRQLKT